MDKDDIVSVLYGSSTYRYRCVAYCRRHGKYMTCKILKQKQCLGKSCKWLDKLEHHYWTTRALVKAKKKQGVFE